MQNAILLHNQHWQGKSFNIAIKRSLLTKLLGFNNTKEIQIITGLRRSGKSSLLKLYINELIKTENPKSILFINFDDPNYSEVYQYPEKIYSIVELAEKLTQTKIQYLFLDEIQSVNGWEKYVKSVYDAERFKKICITGSNSKLLLGNYSGLLSGRYIANQMFPLSLTEILNHYHYSDPLAVLQNKPKILNLIEDCLKHGTFPELILKNDEQIKHEILTNYYDSILIKDCVINKNIRDTKSFKELAFYIFNNMAALFSYNSLSKATGINDVSVKEYINAMQEAFMVYEIPHFSYQIKAQIKSKRKIYAVDNGLITAASLNFSENKGKLFENFVFSELLKAGYDNIFLYNDNKECDFILKKGKKTIAIQAAFEMNTSNREREINGLLHIRDKLNISNLYIVTLSQSEKINDTISIIPIYELYKISED
jgi:uncharacterized protein